MPRKKNIFKGQGPAAALATLNSLPTTQVDVPYESPKDRTAREAREEEARRVQPILAQGNALRAEAEKKIKAFWSQPLMSLASAIDPNQKAASWATAITGPQTSYDGRVDVNLGSFATTDAPFTDEILNASFATLAAFKQAITARTGCVLSEQGCWRLFAFVGVQSEHQGLDSTNIENYFTALDRLQQLEGFNDGEYGYDSSLKAARPAPASAKQPTLDDFDSTTPEGRKLQAELTEDVYLTEHVKPTWHAWLRSLESGFNFRSTATQERAAYDVFREFGLNFLDTRSYDRCRIILVHRRIFPRTCLTAQDVLDEFTESHDMNDRENRMTFARESARLREGRV
jgi:hypothetical protein